MPIEATTLGEHLDTSSDSFVNRGEGSGLVKKSQARVGAEVSTRVRRVTGKAVKKTRKKVSRKPKVVPLLVDAPVKVDSVEPVAEILALPVDAGGVEIGSTSAESSALDAAVEEAVPAESGAGSEESAEVAEPSENGSGRDWRSADSGFLVNPDMLDTGDYYDSEEDGSEEEGSYFDDSSYLDDDEEYSFSDDEEDFEYVPEYDEDYDLDYESEYDGDYEPEYDLGYEIEDLDGDYEYDLEDESVSIDELMSEDDEVDVSSFAKPEIRDALPDELRQVYDQQARGVEKLHRQVSEGREVLDGIEGVLVGIRDGDPEAVEALDRLLGLAGSSLADLSGGPRMQDRLATLEGRLQQSEYQAARHSWCQEFGQQAARMIFEARGVRIPAEVLFDARAKCPPNPTVDQVLDAVGATNFSVYKQAMERRKSKPKAPASARLGGSKAGVGTGVLTDVLNDPVAWRRHYESSVM